MIGAIPGCKPVLMILSRPPLLERGLNLAWHALHHFFWPQFQTRLLPRIRPVAVLSHPLDRWVPFRPREVRTYLGYMGFWLKSLRFLYDLLGKAAIADIRDSFDQVCLMYREAGFIYRRCQSTTTTRSAMPLNPWFAAIYLFDPHLHCIPSLHVLVICYNARRLAEILRRHGRLDPVGLSAVREAQAQAARVTEAILAVRQHSLADIAPSLFLLSCLYRAFGTEEVTKYAGALFRFWRLPEPIKRSMRACIINGYRELRRRLSSRPKSGFRELILGFLAEHIPTSDS